jgi:sugar lactone lactonase YvrE
MSGNIIVADRDNHRIRKISFPNGLIPNGGVVTTIAGNGSPTYLNGIGTNSSFYSPSGVAVGPDGNIYVADTDNYRLRKIVFTDNIPDTSSPLAWVITGAIRGATGSTGNTGDTGATGLMGSTGISFYSGNSVPTQSSIAGDSFLNVTTGTLYKYYYTGISGNISLIAGSGSFTFANGTGSSASFYSPYGVTIDTNGNMLIADTFNNRIRLVTPSGEVTTLAGNGAFASTDGTGTGASFNQPRRVVMHNMGYALVSDYGGHRIRKIEFPDGFVPNGGVVTTLAGSGSAGFADGTGTGASFRNPMGLALDYLGNIYVADSGNYRIRRITPEGVVTTIAGNGSPISVDSSNPLTASFKWPLSLYSDGYLYVGDSFNIRKIDFNGQDWLGVSTLAGSGSSGFVDGTGTEASFGQINGLTSDPNTGNFFVADTTNNRIRKVTPQGVVTTIAGNGQSGYVNGIAMNSSFSSPSDVAFNSTSGEIIIADTGNSRIRKMVFSSSVPDLNSPLGWITNGSIVYAGTIGSTGPTGPAGTPVFATSGTIDKSGFQEQTEGPATGQFYKQITINGMYANGLVLATANGTPGVSKTAWITSVVPGSNSLTFWLAANPDIAGETWKAHYMVTSYGSAS